MNAALAFIESAKPIDEVESALVIQMACTHTAAMAVLGTVGAGHGPDPECCAQGLRGSPTIARVRKPGGSTASATEWEFADHAN